jgi:uncharacterized membrane protein YfcA
VETALQHVLASPWIALAILSIVFVAAIVQFGLGMGFGLAAAPLLALLDPQLVPASVLFLGLATASWGAWSERNAIAWNEVWIAAAGRLTGVVAASLVLASISNRSTFSLWFGVMVAVAVLLSVSGWRLAFSRSALLAMGTLSGLMGTITSVGAPPLAIVYQDRSARSARPTLSAFFALGCCLSLLGLYLSGWAGLQDFILATFMVPGVLAGRFVARRIGTRFDRRYRSLLLAISGTAGLVLIARGLAG